MAIKGMNLNWITVTDIKKSKKFFHEILGLPIKQDTPEHNWLEVAPEKNTECRLGIGQANPEYPDEKPGTNAVITFTVDNLIAEKKRLESLGVKFLGDIIEIPHHVKMVTFVDYDGNRFQLVELLS